MNYMDNTCGLLTSLEKNLYLYIHLETNILLKEYLNRQ